MNFNSEYNKAFKYAYTMTLIGSILMMIVSLGVGEPTHPLIIFLSIVVNVAAVATLGIYWPRGQWLGERGLALFISPAIIGWRNEPIGSMPWKFMAIIIAISTAVSMVTWHTVPGMALQLMAAAVFGLAAIALYYYMGRAAKWVKMRFAR